MNSHSAARTAHFADAELLARAAGEQFVELAGQAIADRGQFTVALGGGSTPRRLYQLLAEPPLRDRTDWSKVHFFWGDERAVPPDHADSNFKMAHESLLSKLDLAPQQVHRMPAERSDLDQAAREYQAEIARVLKAPSDGPPPSLDLVLLGMGGDGHTASLFPDTQALDETSRWVVANFVPKFNTWRMTMTAPMLNAARAVRFLVAGQDKQGVLAEVQSDRLDTKRLPSQLIRPRAGNVTWLVSP